jgi:hypothetical protein
MSGSLGVLKILINKVGKESFVKFGSTLEEEFGKYEAYSIVRVILSKLSGSLETSSSSSELIESELTGEDYTEEEI